MSESNHSSKNYNHDSYIPTKPSKDGSTYPVEGDGHYYWLDLIRFIAAFAVMACHFRSSFFVEYSDLAPNDHNPIVFGFYFITRLGFEAVLIFFVLSGLLVGGRTIKRLENRTFRARDYAIDRFVRIMLPLIASLLLYLPICLAFDIPIIIENWLCSLLSLQGIFTDGAFETLWSLSYEVWFYILFFAIGLIFSRGRKSKFWLGITILAISISVFIKLGATFLYIWLIAAIFFARYRSNNNRHNSIIISISLFITLISICLLQIGSGSHVVYSSSFIGSHLFRNYLFIAIGVSFTIFSVFIIKRKLRHKWSTLLNKYGSKLAAFSYTLYLTHVPVMRLLEGLGAPKSGEINVKSVALYLCWLSVSLVIAYLIYLLFERNTYKVKRYLKTRLTKNAGISHKNILCSQ